MIIFFYVLKCCIVVMRINKACPVIIRTKNQIRQILAFLHPLAGLQIVKGTIENKELLEEACERELFEESGVRAMSKSFLGYWEAGYENQVWGFCLMEPQDKLMENWTHFTEDGGGLEFSFFWQSLDDTLSDNWHPLFKGAVGYIKSREISGIGVP